MTCYKRVGTCNYCGECCRMHVSVWYMTGYDPRKSSRTSGCRFLKDMGDGAFKCRIRMGEIFWNRLSENVKKYYKQVCEPYPVSNNDKHWGMYLPKECTFKRVEM